MRLLAGRPRLAARAAALLRRWRPAVEELTALERGRGDGKRGAARRPVTAQDVAEARAVLEALAAEGSPELRADVMVVLMQIDSFVGRTPVEIWAALEQGGTPPSVAAPLVPPPTESPLPTDEPLPLPTATPTPAYTPTPTPGPAFPARVITYTYDPLHRLTGAYYSTGERYEYAYDAVGNRTAYTATTPLAGTTVTTYTYDAANRLLVSVSPGHPVTYTWDARGNLTGDSTFTYAYDAAGRMVRTQSLTATIIYTYTADGLRVGQSTNGTLTTYAWDWASPVPELLAQSTGSQSTPYLLGHETLGWAEGGAWRYVLPDALGSVRQVADGAGAVVQVREWDPYGVEVGGPQAGLGYTGEWQDAAVGLVYLRARWYAPGVGRFTMRDPFPGQAKWPQSQNPYSYAGNNPMRWADPSGLQCCILSWEDPFPAFFARGDPYLYYEPWNLPWPGSISIAEIEFGFIPLPDWLPIDVLEITLWEGGEIEFWMRYIKRLQDGESWHVKTCLAVKGFRLSLHWEKMYLVEKNVTVVLSCWRQDLVIVTTSRYSPPQRHIGLGWDVEPQPGPWDYSEDLEIRFHSNGEWPYDNLEWR